MAAGLRPTLPRLHILALFDGMAPGESLCVEDVFRRLVDGGHHVSIGTIYRTAQQLEERGLLARGPGEGRRQRFGLGARGTQARAGGVRSVELDDLDLRERVLAAARQAGLLPERGRLTLELDALAPRCRLKVSHFPV
jgi:Fe2+ or Zn2+ uptake regulation protein